MRLALFATVAALAGAPVAAQETPAPPPPEKDIVVKGKADPDKMVCKRQTRTGSVMLTSRCRTVAQWEAETENSRIALERFQQDQRAQRHTAEARTAGRN